MWNVAWGGLDVHSLGRASRFLSCLQPCLAAMEKTITIDQFGKSMVHQDGWMSSYFFMRGHRLGYFQSKGR
jgi:hypothetical protein